MTLRTVLIVALAVVFGVAAAVYATHAVSMSRTAADKEKVVVVVTPIRPGGAVTADSVALKDVTRGEEPEDALKSLDEAIGCVATVDLLKDDVLVRRKLAPKGTSSGLAPLIPEGMQAATILTPTASSGVGGFLKPGNFVDVCLTVDHFAADDHGGTVRLLQTVKVLATDSRMDSAPPTDAGGKIMDNHEMRYVTLLVTPKEAQVLADAQRRGTLTLLLRKPGDTTEYSSDPVTPADLKYPKVEPKPESVKPAAEVKVVEAPPPPPPPIRFSRGGSAEAPSPAP